MIQGLGLGCMSGTGPKALTVKGMQMIPGTKQWDDLTAPLML